MRTINIPSMLRKLSDSSNRKMPTDDNVINEVETRTGYAFETSNSFKAYAKSKTFKK